MPFGLSEMPITLSMHRRLGLHLIRFENVVTFDELVELGRLHATFPAFAAADAIHIIESDADMSQLHLSQIDLLRDHYARLQRSLDLYLVRRAAWVCSTATTCRLVEYWLDGRHSLDGQQTEVVVGSDLAEASPLFLQDEIEAVRNEREFTQISRIGRSDAQSQVSW
ncbi:MAG: hypothetical protein KDA35_05915 [Hyphomonadaceae bacterium]|nr:hypothetical protein [Hyphomonadaceae bacterium]